MSTPQQPGKDQRPADSEHAPSTPKQKHDPETCKCVKCSIVYHESIIRSVNDMRSIVCRKCSAKMVACKCCTESTGSISGVSSTSSTSVTGDEKQMTKTADNKTQNDRIKVLNSLEPIKKDEFESKLFNIKNELVIKK